MNFSLQNTRDQRAKHSRGFSLIELLVVVSIIIVISTVILARYGQFNGKVLLRNLAYDVALSIREAQVYSTSGKIGTGSSSLNYGVYFTSSTQYILFADTDGNGKYNSGEAVEVLKLKAGYTISDFCAQTATTDDCNITKLHITFKRPDPDAIIKTDLASSGYQSATIILHSQTGDTRTVTVTLTGQIAVQQ